MTLIEALEMIEAPLEDAIGEADGFNDGALEQLAAAVSFTGKTPSLLPVTLRAVTAQAGSAPALGRPLVDVLHRTLNDPTVSYERVCEYVRLIGRIQVSADGCWHWVGVRNHLGYGTVRATLAHRAVYEAVHGQVPLGLHLDHLCRVRHCVNPDHLEPVTPAENARRGTVGHVNREKTHCPANHPYDEANTRFYNGHRVCRACSVAAALRHRRKVATCR